MNLLVFWLGTSISSFCVEMSNELRMFKDVADAGYKIDVKKMSELNKQINPDGLKVSLLTMLIPIYNIIHVFKKVMKYNNIRPVLLDQLRVINALEEMTEIEKEEYLKKPTGLNAVIIPFKTEIRLSKAASIKINDETGKSEIFFESGESLEDITILKVDGPASRLTVDEQKKKVIDALNKLYSALTEKYPSPESLIDALTDNTKLDLSQSSEDKKDETCIKQESNISEKKQVLENFKNELLKKQQMMQKSTDKKGQILTKKIK